MKSVVRALAVVSVLGGSALAVSNSFADSHGKENPQLQFRQLTMKVLGGNMGAVAAVAKGQAEYTPNLINNAKVIEAIGAQILDLWPEGSAGGRSKDEIWSDKAKFEEAGKAFTAAAPGLVAAVESGDAGKIGEALGAVGKTCGGCHKPFRKEKKKE